MICWWEWMPELSRMQESRISLSLVKHFCMINIRELLKGEIDDGRANSSMVISVYLYNQVDKHKWWWRWLWNMSGTYLLLNHCTLLRLASTTFHQFLYCHDSTVLWKVNDSPSWKWLIRWLGSDIKDGNEWGKRV